MKDKNVLKITSKGRLGLSTPNPTKLLIAGLPNTKIWFADDACYQVTANYKWWQKLFVKVFFGWRIEKLQITTKEK